MGSKYTKLNERYGVLKYPVTLTEMVETSKGLPKTELKFYEYAFDALKKTMKQGEKYGQKKS